MKTPSLSEEAILAHERGWVLTPLSGKRPTETGWNTAPRPSLETLIGWARTGNLGLRTGTISGVVVIDDDTADGSGISALNLPITITVITGSGKRHAYFRAPEGGLRNSIKKLPGVDIRSDGGQVVYVGSLHPETGQPYRWAEGLSPTDVPLADLPPRILDALRAAPKPPPPSPRIASTMASLGQAGDHQTTVVIDPEVRPKLNSYISGVRKRATTSLLSAQEGERNHTLNKAAYSLGQFVGAGLLDEQVALSDLRFAASAAGLPDEESAKTIESGVRGGKNNPKDVSQILQRIGRPRKSSDPEEVQWDSRVRPLTDTGNAERLVSLHGEDLRYCHPWSKWLVWTGSHWATESRGELMQLSKKTVRTIEGEVAYAATDTQAEAIRKWSAASEKLERRRALINLGQSEEGIPVLPDDLDTHNWSLNVANGTIDLRTQTLKAHDRAQLITKLCPVTFDRSATSPIWTKFLNHVIPDPLVRSFLQRGVGWSLTGDVGAQVLFFLYGKGSNGKSVFLATLQHLLGTQYAIQAAPELVLLKTERGHPTDQADLFGVRVAVCTEIGANRSFDEVMIKQLTGGDRIRARRMREDFWEFSPTHHIWIGANHCPRIRGTDHAIWRRILLVPFPVTISPEEKDADLPTKLAAESSGILNWALEGLAQYQLGGLSPPDAVLAATADYRQEMDDLAGFLAERCDFSDATARVSAADLYKAYTASCLASGEEQVTQKIFGMRLTERGIARRVAKGRKFYQGIRLRSDGDSGGDGGDDQRPISCIPDFTRAHIHEKHKTIERRNTESRSPSSPSSPQETLPSGYVETVL